MNNPLLEDIRRLLEQQPSGLDEYAIHRQLATNRAFSALGSGDLLSLFRKHFMVMNALYELQRLFWESSPRRVLRISPLHIQLYIEEGTGETGFPGEHTSGAEFYLDWNHYHQTDEAKVKALLDRFWQQYFKQEHRQAALETLQLDTDADSRSIEQRYRQLAARYHPDKGGDAEQFIRIREAYEQLR